ncbi:DEKNAAC105228 [Brettanomyces naardenensis]|uniref:alpha,alpha-trehalase n=1 Tax=Brettanomyces naardenensis TaxID=13370 RepID=A0A448YSS5_BRENA|nr:DEKNAAC105228 [Brettanomyces naardenensis]
MKLSTILLSATAVASPFPSEFDYHDSSTDTYYYQDERLLATLQFNPYNHFTNQPYVANGYIGSRIPNLGFGFSYDQNANVTSSALSNGWPLFDERYSGAFVAGFYDAQPNTTGTNFPELLDDGGYESVISAIPQWTQLSFRAILANGSEFILNPQDMKNRGQISGYSQSLDMAHGIVTTAYDWLNLFHFNISVLAHQQISTLGLVSVDITPLSPSNVSSLSVNNTLDFFSSQRCWLDKLGEDHAALWMTVFPENLPYKAATVYSLLHVTPTLSNDSAVVTYNDSISANYEISLDCPSTLYKYVGIASDDLFDTNRSSKVFDTAKQTVIDAASLPWVDLVDSHKSAWTDLWGENRITVQDDSYLTLTAEASIYHLLANTRSSNDNVTSALGVGGLSSDSYGGMVFWDADLWMMPGLQAFAPENAAAVAQFRKYIHPQAVENALINGYNGSVYSWTSGRFGNCTGTGPCINYEYHLNVAICYSIWKLYLSGSIDDAELRTLGWPIMRDTADFFSEYVKYNDTLGKYTTHNLTDPDEYANFKNNAAYTSIGIAQVMKWATLVGNYLGEKLTPQWKPVMDNMYLAVSDDNVTLEYDTMNSSVSVKQADVVLISYIDDQDGFLPNVYGYDKNRAYTDLVYYSDRQAPQGPAMTYPVYMAVSEKLNDYGCGYHTYLQQSVRPFIRFPFAQMSEQNNDDYETNGGTHPAFPFLTGHGGVVQSYYFGLLGLRYSYSTGADNKIQRVLHVDPVNLPRFSGNFSIDGFHYLNETIDIDVDSTGCGAGNNDSSSCSATFISHGHSNTSVFLYVDNRNAHGGLHELSSGASLTVPLFVPAMNLEGSYAECLADTAAVSEGVDGDVLDAIVDGDNSTSWQVLDKTQASRVMIDLKAEHSFTKGAIVWGPRPAKTFTVSILPGGEDLSKSDMVRVRKTFDPDTESYYNVTTIVSSQEVKITSPFNADDVEVKIQDMNYTTFELGSTYTARYVVLDVMGVIDKDDNAQGAEIAEFGLFK